MSILVVIHVVPSFPFPCADSDFRCPPPDIACAVCGTVSLPSLLCLLAKGVARRKFGSLELCSRSRTLFAGGAASCTTPPNRVQVGIASQRRTWMRYRTLSMNMDCREAGTIVPLASALGRPVEGREASDDTGVPRRGVIEADNTGHITKRNSNEGYGRLLGRPRAVEHLPGLSPECVEVWAEQLFPGLLEGVALVRHSCPAQGL
ncbi:hypothetical protein BV22DRAFT_576465 [Leucogyrophana mollusca]|uniref:Uncharacterized protein n=1 Tax=Leucogyrophana mollusca TaxID=85980 RepID=A0ACB8BCS7_9AGAM|nr:hypothetical protein BV22DRAFT_576465 [Leucogyrophana mollusca]